MRVLVIEDDVGLASVISLALVQRGWDVYSAASVADADATGCDVILADLTLGTMRPPASLAAVLELADGIPVVVHTGTVEEGQFEAILDAGAADVVEKPASVREIHRRLLAVTHRLEHSVRVTRMLGTSLERLSAATGLARDLAFGVGRDVGG